MDTPDLTETEADAIYLGLERCGGCEHFIDRFAGCAAGEAECHCFAIGACIVKALEEMRQPVAADQCAAANAGEQAGDVTAAPPAARVAGRT